MSLINAQVQLNYFVWLITDLDAFREIIKTENHIFYIEVWEKRYQEETQLCASLLPPND